MNLKDTLSSSFGKYKNPIFTTSKLKNRMARILTGIQSTGTPHLGNLLGAIIPAIELSKDKKNESLFFIADLHSFTSIRDAQQLRENTYATAAAWLAFGFDTDKNLFYRQSEVVEVCELTWYLNCFTPFPMLANAHSFKDKSSRLSEVNSGLFTYPVLMAADILLYDATHVPVGDDQKQHLELSRDIAQKFNNDFGVEFFPQPEPLIYGSATRVMSLRDGSKKMSKSDPSDFSRILLTDSDDTISTKIKKAKSDSELIPGSMEELQSKPECLNLINILSATTNQSVDQVLSNYTGKEYSSLKRDLADSLVQMIGPIRNEINNLLNNQDELNVILAEGTEKAAAIANPIIEEVYKIVGFK